MIIQRETFIMLRNVSSGGYVRTMRVVVCLIIPSDSTHTHLIGLFPAGTLWAKDIPKVASFRLYDCVNSCHFYFPMPIVHTQEISSSQKSRAHRVQEMEIFPHSKDIYEAMPCPDDQINPTFEFFLLLLLPQQHCTMFDIFFAILPFLIVS